MFLSASVSILVAIACIFATIAHYRLYLYCRCNHIHYCPYLYHWCTCSFLPLHILLMLIVITTSTSIASAIVALTCLKKYCRCNRFLLPLHVQPLKLFTYHLYKYHHWNHSLSAFISIIAVIAYLPALQLALAASTRWLCMSTTAPSYSALVLDSVIVGCFLLLQEITALPNENVYPDVDLRLLAFPAQWASV